MVIFYSLIIGVTIFGVVSGSIKSGDQLVSYLPIGNSSVEYLIVIFIFYPLCMIIGCIFGLYVMYPFYLFIYKNIIGRNMEYGIYNHPKDKEYKNKYDFFIPSLIAANFSLLLVNTIPQTIKDIFLARGTIDEGFTLINTFLAGFVLTLFLALLLYSPVWYFLNSGIVFSNKKKVDDFVDPIEIRSIGNWYKTILRGYAGIGLVITYLQFLVTTFVNLVMQK